MNRILNVVWAAALSLLLAACGTAASDTAEAGASGNLSPTQQQEQTSILNHSTVPEEAAVGTPAEEGASIALSVGEQTFSITLLENESARQLAKMLPLTLDMSELKGNEKYFYLDSTLTTDSSQPGQINAGDLMLYGNNCLVLFYESFSSGYSYTRLGSLDDPTGLSEALGTGRVEVTFSIGDE